MKKQIDALLMKEMDRKDFLKYAGGLILAVLGVTGITKLLLSQAGIETPAEIHKRMSNQQSGYGNSPYGR